MSERELDAIQKRILDEMKCPLKDAATKLVFGKGNPDADVLFVGEAPGKDEDLQGIPFVGRAGKELDNLLHGIGLSLAEVYIANILKYRPPNNRDPSPEEIRRHTPYLVRQIRAIKPKVICTLGNFSTKFVLAGFKEEGMKAIPGMMQIHGQIKTITVEGTTYTVMPLYHPAAMLYRPQLRQELEKDFLKLGEFLGTSGGQATLQNWG